MPIVAVSRRHSSWSLRPKHQRCFLVVCAMVLSVFSLCTQNLVLERDGRFSKIPRAEPLPKKGKKHNSRIVTHPPYNGTLQRVFQPYAQPELPCVESGIHDYQFGIDGKYGKVDTVGMFFAKLHKCSSSTLAGIAAQIARNTAARRRKAGIPDTPKSCLLKANHGHYSNVMMRDKKRSMLWTFIREPASRQVSRYFHFHVSRLGADPTNDTLFQANVMRSNLMVDYLTGNILRKQNMTVEEKVGYVMNAYDFIGLVERYHESLILLKMILTWNCETSCTRQQRVVVAMMMGSSTIRVR